MNLPSINVSSNDFINTKQFVMGTVSMPEMKMEMGFTKLISIALKVFGHSCALGLDHIEAFLKINFLFI